MAALAALFPAATARKTPAWTRAAAAEFTAVDLLPPRDMLATEEHERVGASLATKLMPEMTPELVPDPLESRTLTAYSVVNLATP